MNHADAIFVKNIKPNDGEVIRNDEKFSNVSVWEYKGEGQKHVKHEEPIEFDLLKPMTRSYK